MEKEEAETTTAAPFTDSPGFGSRGAGGAAEGGGGAEAGAELRLSSRYKIHYPGWISRWDEWVDRKRLRWSWQTNDEVAATDKQ